MSKNSDRNLFYAIIFFSFSRRNDGIRHICNGFTCIGCCDEFTRCLFHFFFNYMVIPLPDFHKDVKHEKKSLFNFNFYPED